MISCVYTFFRKWGSMESAFFFLLFPMSLFSADCGAYYIKCWEYILNRSYSNNLLHRNNISEFRLLERYISSRCFSEHFRKLHIRSLSISFSLTPCFIMSPICIFLMSNFIVSPYLLFKSCFIWFKEVLLIFLI